MWVTVGRAVLSFLPKDKIIFAIIFIPLGAVFFIGMLFASPGTVSKHVPLADDAQYNFYVQAVNQIKNETGKTVDWQQIMAIDAVVLNQDFTSSSKAKAYSYKKYFIREEQETYSCPAPSASGDTSLNAGAGQTGNGTSTSSTTTCTRTVYYLRSFDEVLNLLVRAHVITADQIDDVKDYTKFKLTFEPGEGDDDSGGLVIQGDFEFSEGIFLWPLPAKNTRVTSQFGMRVHPVTGEVKGHLGTDLAAATGTNVYAIDDGKVIRASEYGTGGEAVFIQHKSNVVSMYLHLSEYKVRKGDNVKKGDIIALSGATGRVTGPHLHFQIEVNGTPVDPLKFY